MPGEYDARTRYQKTEVADWYHSWLDGPLVPSTVRARIFGWREEAAFDRMMKGRPQDCSVLDVACGTGRYLERLLERGHRVAGADMSVPMLKYAVERTGGHPRLLSVQAADAARLPFGDDEFDGITCIRLYQRVPTTDRVEMLREVRRVARDWAILFFGMSTPWLQVRQRIRSLFIKGRENNPNAVTWSEMHEELEEAGLELERCTWVLPGLATGLLIRVSCGKP